MCTPTHRKHTHALIHARTHACIQAVWVMEFTINGLRWNLDSSLMDTGASKCFFFLFYFFISERFARARWAACAVALCSPLDHFSVPFFYFYFYLCAPCFSRCAIKRVTVVVVTVNVFPRADEIEMLMTDLERANQVTCPNPLCPSCLFLFCFFSFFPPPPPPWLVSFYCYITQKARHSLAWCFFFFIWANFKNALQN